MVEREWRQRGEWVMREREVYMPVCFVCVCVCVEKRERERERRGRGKCEGSMH